jgi:hypothetical protein
MYRNASRIAIAVAILFAAFNTACSAQSNAEFNSFWNKFTSAVASGNRTTLNSMISFPLAFEGDTEDNELFDDMFESPYEELDDIDFDDNISQARFMEMYDRIFTKQAISAMKGVTNKNIKFRYDQYVVRVEFSKSRNNKFRYLFAFEEMDGTYKLSALVVLNRRG